MSYRKYRNSLYVLLLTLLGIIRGVYAASYEHEDKSSAAIFNDTKTVAMEELEPPAGKDLVGVENGEKLVIPGGDPIGIYVKSDGVMVISPGEVTDESGNKFSPCQDILNAGDYIVAIDDESVNDKKELIKRVKESKGNSLKLTINRNGKILFKNVNPVKTNSGYMLGLWVKDDISGIGTLTYIDENGFGALGHSINDNDTGKIFKVCDGALYFARLLNIVKPEEDKPGKLEGVIDYSKGGIIGRINNNCGCGVSGYITSYGAEKIDTSEWIPVAKEEQVNLGEAYILTAISGVKEYYKVEITDLDINSSNNKNLEIKIIDDRLLEKTGGIVQGLSGTPIIQNGRLIGAITHVFVNDATRGYGIYIGNMLEGDK